MATSVLLPRERVLVAPVFALPAFVRPVFAPPELNPSMTVVPKRRQRALRLRQ